MVFYLILLNMENGIVLQQEIILEPLGQNTGRCIDIIKRLKNKFHGNTKNTILKTIGYLAGSAFFIGLMVFLYLGKLFQ